MHLMLGGGRLMPGPAKGEASLWENFTQSCWQTSCPLFKYKFHIRISKMEWRGHWTSLLLLLLCLFLLVAIICLTDLLRAGGHTYYLRTAKAQVQSLATS